jgi:hypothetical protein
MLLVTQVLLQQLPDAKLLCFGLDKQGMARVQTSFAVRSGFIGRDPGRFEA